MKIFFGKPQQLRNQLRMPSGAAGASQDVQRTQNCVFCTVFGNENAQTTDRSPRKKPEKLQKIEQRVGKGTKKREFLVPSRTTSTCTAPIRGPPPPGPAPPRTAHTQNASTRDRPHTDQPHPQTAPTPHPHGPCQRNSMFLTHFASVDCVNSDSCSELTIQSCHVFFCATTVVFSAFQ